MAFGFSGIEGQNIDLPLRYLSTEKLIPGNLAMASQYIKLETLKIAKGIGLFCNHFGLAYSVSPLNWANLNRLCKVKIMKGNLE